MQRYRRTLRLPTDGRGQGEPTSGEASALAAALDRAYELRNFEIEHYWKRGTYFWGFQLAIFAAYGLLWKEGGLAGNSFDVALALSSLGILTACANVLSMQGSKFWYTNWEHHIDMLEDQVEGRLHRIVWLDGGGGSYSVTRVNRVLGWCFLAFWVVVACMTAWIYPGLVPRVMRAWISGHVYDLGVFHLNPARLKVGTAFVAVAGLCHWMCRQRTRLSGTVPTDDGDPGPVEFQEPTVARVARPQAIYILRHGPSGEWP